ncbi:MAG: putative nuclease with TOPRIM domain [Phenylobacterium sp.]|jgi:predicted nuclease with TOPRIM domain
MNNDEDTDVDKTRVDDMLIEMIKPKLKEIEMKFSQEQGLSNEDINTLLLKSQYNHINHLDLRMDEVTADVASLKGEFGELKGEFSGLKGEFRELRGEFKLHEQTMELKISNLINNNMRWSIGLIALIVTLLKLADTFVK